MAEGDTVVVAIDSSEHSTRALDFYLNHMHRENNSLILAHAVEIPYQPVQPLREEVVADILARTKSAAKVVEDRFDKLLKDKGVNHVVRSEFGHPGEYICKVSQEVKATMVVMGTRGMGSIRRTILGSVSDYVIHHAHCPVVVCKH